MSYKMKGFSGFKSPLKQNGDKCYIDKNGKKVCPSVIDQNPFKPKKKKTKKKEKTEKEKWIEREDKKKPFKEEWHKNYFYNKAKNEPDLEVKKENIA